MLSIGYFWEDFTETFSKTFSYAQLPFDKRGWINSGSISPTNFSVIYFVPLWAIFHILQKVFVLLMSYVRCKFLL
jgi:hypothetical protein